MTKEKKSIPEGSIRIHLYDYRNVLKPRGSMKRESLGLVVHERLVSVFEEWSDPDYGDNPGRSELLKQIRKNLLSEVEAAWRKLIKNGKNSESVGG